VTVPDKFRFDRHRYEAAADLRPEHFDDFSRLIKTLRFGSRFQLLITEFNDLTYRDSLRRTASWMKRCASGARSSCRCTSGSGMCDRAR
jgi:hypothetical protein